MGNPVDVVGGPSGRLARPVRKPRAGGDSRRPGGTRRPAAGVDYHRVRGAGPGYGQHPLHRVEQARIGLVTLAISALLTAVVVAGLAFIAQSRTPGPPSATETVQVQSGESLSQVAERVAPGIPVRDTVSRIAELNGLGGADVVAGRTLVVPAR
ncbi:MAG: LysM peptidoglycan-binding domain-containing protein [Nocardia sp.]|nr:LysM peptidoglycan-binding domain-containing protein [Nocardia sp.]